MASTLFGRTKLAGSILLEVPVEPPELVPDHDPVPVPVPEPAEEPDETDELTDDEEPPPPPPQEARINKVTNRNVDPNLFINFSLYDIDNTT